ncbi:WXG100 family type VII secretion target [Kitasatospora acidiphila]|uniref:WXG100 family type VII secretion target n=1 Tax=Kitasatospora acidiphila TaxID=2567942 RepID=UPI003C759444
MAQNPDSGQTQTQTPPPPKIEQSFDIFSPGGDPSVLRDCALAWRGMAADLKTTRDSLDKEVSGLGDAWTGAAATAFHQHWQGTRGQIDGALPNFEAVAKQLDAAADSIEEVNKQIQEIVAEIAATAAIGIGLSIVTAGFSDAAAAASASVEAGEASAAVARLAKILKDIADVLEGIKKAMDTNKFLKFGVKFAGNFGANLGGNVLGQALSGQQITWGTDIQNAGVSAVVGTGLGELGSAAAPKVAQALTSSGAHATQWAGKDVIDGMLKGDGLLGGAVNNSVTSAAGTAAADGVNEVENPGSVSSFWEDVAFSGLGGAAGGAAVHNGRKIYAPGKHRAGGDPILGDALSNAGAYGLAGASENDDTGEPAPQVPFDKGSPLIDPKGAYHQ